MFAFLRGKIAAYDADSVVLDTGSIGFRVYLPQARLEKPLHLGDELFLHTFLQVREDAWTLFGFPKEDQLEMFLLLTSISGIGAKLALLILNGLSVSQIVAAVNQDEHKRFSAISGIGDKIAKRIVLELKTKLPKLGLESEEGFVEMPAADDGGDTVAALLQLGYNSTEARMLYAKAVAEAGAGASGDVLLRTALRLAAKL